MIGSYYEEEIRALNKNKIKYLVVGGLAVNLYGLHRLTRDLDLMVDLSLPQDSLGKFIKTISMLGYYTKVPENKWEKLSAIAFMNKKDQDKRIDVFLKNPIEFDKAYSRRKVFKANKFAVSCVSFDDLIKLKNIANRLRDWIDVGSLKRIKELRGRK
jgi:hypothetical protein